MKNNISKNFIFNSKTLYFYFIIFFLTFILFRIILPLGDEPDYFHRYSEYILNLSGFLYYTGDFSQAVTCNSVHQDTSLFGYSGTISPFFCNNSISDFIIRTFIGLILNFIFFFIVYCLVKNNLYLKIFKSNKKRVNLNLHIFFASLLYPTVIYYLGTRSNEIFVFYIVLLFFFTWKNIFISYLLSFSAILIDFGNGSIFLLFISYFYFLRALNLKYKLDKIIIFNLIVYALLIIYEREFQNFLVGYFEKSNIIYLQNFAEHVFKVEKLFLYANFVKLIITYFSFIFMTPGFLKSTLLIVTMTGVIIYTILTIFNYVKNIHFKENLKLVDNQEYFFNAIVCIGFVILSVLIFPTHSFIRYYLFIFPFIFSLFFLVFGKDKIILVSIFGILFISIETLIFRINYFLS